MSKQKPAAEADGTRYTSGWKAPKESIHAPEAATGLGGQNYAAIKAQCRKEKRLFEDPAFPALDTSLYFRNPPEHDLTWMRPAEICRQSNSKPAFVLDGASRFDVGQGELGDCWFVAAIACLSQFPDLLHKVVPIDQSFTDDYQGIFRFRFWVNGEWTEVVVDDLLPTYQGRLVYIQSSSENEFWSSLLEKAYAKLNGSYESLVSGKVSEALEDFTGGLTEVFILKDPKDAKKQPPPNLYEILQHAHSKGSLMGCSINQDSPGGPEEPMANGLHKGHAYSITGFKTVTLDTTKETVRLIRVRNPWGDDNEWKGKWSDKSSAWNDVSKAERDKLLVKGEDGEFWMSCADFVREFHTVEMCNLGATISADKAGDSKSSMWSMHIHQGSWIPKVNAGGWRKHSETFWTNPKYIFDIVDPDESDADNTGTVLLALMQCNRRKLAKEGLGMLQIGYCIYEMKNGVKVDKLDKTFFQQNGPLADCTFSNRREVMGRHKLPVGRYVVVPSTVNPNCKADFLVRIYTEKPVESREMNEATNCKKIRPAVPAAPPPAVSVDHARNGHNGVTPNHTAHTAAEKYNRQTSNEANSEERIRSSFNQIAGEDGEIDAWELQGVLNSVFMKEFKFDGFSIDTCRSLVAMKDMDHSGKLGFEEFKILWAELRTWKNVFKQEDKDHSGTFDSYELRETLRAIGVTVSNQTFNALVQRYSSRNGQIQFNDYIQLIARLTTMFDIFGEIGKGKSKAEFDLDQFIQTTMYS